METINTNPAYLPYFHYRHQPACDVLLESMEAACLRLKEAVESLRRFLLHYCCHLA